MTSIPDSHFNSVKGPSSKRRRMYAAMRTVESYCEVTKTARIVLSTTGAKKITQFWRSRPNEMNATAAVKAMVTVCAATSEFELISSRRPVYSATSASCEEGSDGG